MLKTSLILILCLFLSFYALSQTYPFARLTGSPLDTTGWFLAGAAQIGDTEGDVDTESNEMILCPPINNRSGACFFKKPVNIATCQKWAAEFEYRIWDGNGADGISFFFLNNPPRTYLLGQGMGIPPRPLGLIVAMDPYNNCNNVGSPCCTPKLQIRYGNGINNYSECPNPPQPTSSNLTVIRTPTYNRIRIEYDFGQINVYINETLMLTGFYLINFAGYFGLTSSTGGSNDRHSIKDFVLYTYKPILEAPNAGPDLMVCPRDTVRLGDLNSGSSNYRYLWYPSTGLNDSTLAAPMLTVTNPNYTTQMLRYFVSKDTIAGSESRCSFTDEVVVTVRPRSVALPDSFVACPTTPNTINFAGVSGNRYLWTPSEYLTGQTRSNPTISIPNNSDTVLRRKYNVVGIDSLGCVDGDTLIVVVPPNAAFAGIDKKVCSGDTISIGLPPKSGISYTWFPGSLVLGSNQAEARFSMINNDTNSLNRDLILSAFNSIYQCNNFDTVTVSIAPALTFNINNNQTICSGNPLIMSQNRVSSSLFYSWSPDFGLNNFLLANPTFTATNHFNLPTWYQFEVQVKDTLFGCVAKDSLEVIVNPFGKVEAGNDTAVCSGQSVLVGKPIRAISGTIYQFLNPFREPDTTFMPLPVNQSVNIDTTILYVVRASFQGCERRDTMKVRYKPLPIKPQLVGRKVLCENSSQIVYKDIFNNQQLSWSISNNGSIVSSASDSLVVDWNQLNPRGFVVATARNELGCTTVSDTFLVRITTPVKTSKPVLEGAKSDTFCFSPETSYSIVAPSAGVYTWSLVPESALIFGQGTSRITIKPNGSGTIKITLKEIHSPELDTCISESDTMYLFIHPKPVKPEISGTIEPCEKEFSEYSWQGGSWFTLQTDADSSFRLNGSTISAKWNNSGSGIVAIQVYNEYGCVSDPDTLSINIQPKPSIQFLQADTFICKNQLFGKKYSLSPQIGVLNHWTILGGSIVSHSEDSSHITVNWSESSLKEITLIRISEKGCEAGPKKFRIKTDSIFGDIQLISFDPEDNQKFIVVPFTTVSGRSLPGRLWIREDSDSSEVGNFDFESESYIFDITKQWNTAPGFWAIYQDQCGNMLRSRVHKPVILNRKLSISSDSLEIHWTPYLGWPNGVSSFQIWYQKGEGTDFELLEILSKQTFSRKYLFGKKAFQHCFYVAAMEGGNEVNTSFSNKVCFTFNHTLGFPNVLTQNKDGKNEKFIIQNLELYPPFTFRVFNRFGKQVFESNQYNQDWPTTDIDAGTYFYMLKPAIGGTTYRGWFEVIK